MKSHSTVRVSPAMAVPSPFMGAITAPDTRLLPLAALPPSQLAWGRCRPAVTSPLAPVPRPPIRPGLGLRRLVEAIPSPRAPPFPLRSTRWRDRRSPSSIDAFFRCFRARFLNLQLSEAPYCFNLVAVCLRRPITTSRPRAYTWRGT